MTFTRAALVKDSCRVCPTYISGRCLGKVSGSASAPARRPLATEANTLLRKDKREGDISSVFTSFSGRKAVPLPPRFLDLKKNLTAGFEEQIQKSWDDLTEVLKQRTEEVAAKRESIIPQVKFSDIAAGTVPDAAIKALRDTGVVVIRGVMPKSETEGLLKDVRQYFGTHPMTGFPAAAEKKVVYESYWTCLPHKHG
ncbi:hypothetical protein C366_01821 [Cryptococcus neoformans Tu401-1]|nr:hypothetical protein C366_01821 [Cryptococcus neoformans var. grubii Tu401-1]